MSGIRKGIYIGIPLLLMITIIVMVLVHFNAGSLQNEELQIAEVEIGSVIKSFEGKGVVEPQSEVIILSPASSIIKRILKEAGDHVNAGEPIIILDPTPIQNEIENKQDQLEVKENALRKNRLDARSTIVDLDYNVQVKNLRIASLKSEITDQKQLLDVGGISPAKYEKTLQELELAKKDLKMLKEKNSIKLQQLDANEEGLKLQIDIQEKGLEAMEEKLSKMIIRAPSAGILLSVHGKVGEKVNSDRLLVEMSDLTHFKIKGSVDDDYSDKIKTGIKVYVQIDNKRLSGVVGTINPVIRERKVEFDVNLQESNYFKLRPNLNVPLEIVMVEKDSVLRVINGAFIGRGSEHHVYVLEGTSIVSRDIRTGLKTSEFVEIVEGLNEGERVIVSNMSSIKDIEEIEF